MFRREAAAALADRLLGAAPLWRPVPFHDDPCWVRERPALANALLALPDARVDALDDDADALAAFLSPHLPAVQDIQRAAEACLDHDPVAAPLDRPETDARDVPGRKWAQVLHFAGAIGTPRGDVVEWCSGKAHLGRLLARQHNCRVDALEWNAALCNDGTRLAAREGLRVRVLHRDVLGLTADDGILQPDTHALALHACGDLHIALLRTGSAAGVRALDIAPCCYHLTRDAAWQPLSTELAAHAIAGAGLTRDDLRLAVQETKTASARVVAAQRTLAAWRLGFDLLQRRARGIDAYLPTPPRPASAIADGFPAFCASLAAHHGLRLPADTDYVACENAGRARAARVRRLELVRHAFRRPLEILLVSDRALFLAGRGYDVRVRPFCPRALTPRNLWLQARLPDGTRRGNDRGDIIGTFVPE